MNADSRIEKLEHEFKILKNEIQNTLLEIQEQILIHYYPALRAEGTERPGNLLQVVDALREKRNSNGDKNHNGQGRMSATPAILDDGFDETGDDDDTSFGNDEPVVTPQTREVSLAQLRKRPKAKTPNRRREAEQPNGPVARTSRLNFAALADWVRESVATVGKERAVQAVEAYTSGGYLTEETQTVLLRLISLAEESPLPAVGGSAPLEILIKLDAVLGNAAH